MNSFKSPGYAGLVLLLAFCGNAWAIVNGRPVSDAQFSADYGWAAAVVGKVTGGVCGGVLLAPRWVLTAAHCTGRRKYVLVGHASQPAARRVEIERAIRHPEFSGKTLQNDVGLLYLAEAVEQPLATLPTPTEAQLLLLPGAEATLAGWGNTEVPRKPTERLVEGHIRLNELALFGSQINYNYRGSGPCGRDSGSPMIMTTLDGRRLVVGVASATAGRLCAQGGGAATYTNLAAVLDFIDQHVGGL